MANQELHRGYIQSWNLIVERKLPAEFVASVGYVGSASVNGFAFLDINASQIPGSGDEGRPLFQKFGRTATTREWDGRTHSNYHSLQTTLNRRVLGRPVDQGARTRTRRRSTRLRTPTGRSSCGTRRACSTATVRLRNHDIPHNFQFAVVYELPFGSDKKWATTGASAAILGGWQLNGVFAAYSGRPFTLTASGRLAEHARQPADAGPGQGRTSKSSARLVTMARASTPPHLPGSPTSGSATSAATRCAAPAW